MSLLPFIHFFCFILYVKLAIFVLIRNYKAPLNRVCSLFFLCFALWSFGGIFIHSPSTSKAAALFFDSLTSPGWVSFSSFSLWCALLFCEKKKILRWNFLYPVLFLPAILFIYMQWTNHMVVDYVETYFGWGVVWSPSLWPYLYYVYIILFSAAALFLFFRYGVHSHNLLKKKQAKIIFFSSQTAFSLGFLTDVALPRLHLYVIPDIADIFLLIGAFGFVYMIVKYRFLTITPAAAAENIIATMSESLILLDAEGKIVKVNRAALAMLGFREKELKGRPVKTFMVDKKGHLENPLLKDMLEGKKITDYELSFKAGQDREVPVIFSCSGLKDESGSLIGMVCVSRDITRRKEVEKELNEYKEHLEELVEERTVELKEINDKLYNEIDERKKVEKTLRKSREKYRTLTENIAVGIYRHTLAGKEKFLEVNPAVINMFGFDNKKDLLASPVSRLYNNPEDLKRFNREMSQRGFVKNKELQFKKKNGTLFTGSISAVTVKGRRGKAIYYDGIIEDITTRKQLEEELLQLQKIEAVGRLTGGIAHEFNNILTTIVGYGELSKMKSAPGSPVNNYLSKILKTADHAKNLISQLLAFSRKAVNRPKNINLNSILGEFQKLIRKVLGEDILLEFIPGEKLGNVKADPGQIEQIILNLAANSRDAMPSGGKLTLITENKEVDQAVIDRYPYMKPGFYVLIKVIDTGRGMSSKELAHLFEPFFTTKRKSRGTGLGLSTVYGIVKQNNGFINIRSKQGQGTTVGIYLPRTDGPVEEIKQSTGVFKLPSGKETILVVEDEETVREITVEVLSDCGYHVILAQSGEGALELWEKNKEGIDLLLSDIVLPGISGLQLAHKLQASKPELKVIYMSGYSEDVISQHGVFDKDISFLRKPFTSLALTKMIREVLTS